MGSRDSIDEPLALADTDTPCGQVVEHDALAPLLLSRAVSLSARPVPEVVIGELVAIADEGLSPLVIYPGQPGTAALRARSVLDLHGAHIGKSVVLSFDGGDASRPIVMGVLRQAENLAPDAPGYVQIDADGERMIVSARDELVLKCGKASITLTKAGKVLIQGSYVSSRSTGVNRIKGGSVQLN
jgi:hypothetical protein